MKITWFPKDVLNTSGAFGLSEMPGMIDLSYDLQTLSAAGTTHLVCLLEEIEIQCLNAPETIEARRRSVEEQGINFFHRPIEDFKAPTLEQVEDVVAFVQAALQEEGTVVMHCMAGLGRAGTLAACLLIAEHGFPAGEAILHVRWIRPGAIQSDEQEQLIHAYARHLERM